MILKEMFLAEQHRLSAEKGTEKEKAGASSRTPNAVIYSIKYSTD
jgi:hypothetical protein